MGQILLYTNENNKVTETPNDQVLLRSNKQTHVITQCSSTDLYFYTDKEA